MARFSKATLPLLNTAGGQKYTAGWLTNSSQKARFSAGLRVKYLVRKSASRKQMLAIRKSCSSLSRAITALRLARVLIGFGSVALPSFATRCSASSTENHGSWRGCAIQICKRDACSARTGAIFLPLSSSAWISSCQGSVSRFIITNAPVAASGARTACSWRASHANPAASARSASAAILFVNFPCNDVTCFQRINKPTTIKSNIVACPFSSTGSKTSVGSSKCLPYCCKKLIASRSSGACLDLSMALSCFHAAASFFA